MCGSEVTQALEHCQATLPVPGSPRCLPEPSHPPQELLGLQQGQGSPTSPITCREPPHALVREKKNHNQNWKRHTLGMTSHLKPIKRMQRVYEYFATPFDFPKMISENYAVYVKPFTAFSSLSTEDKFINARTGNKPSIICQRRCPSLSGEFQSFRSLTRGRHWGLGGERR